MIEALILAITISGFYLVYEVIKFNNQIKKDERFNSGVTPIINQKKYKVKSSKKVSKDKTQNKRKPGRPKKKISK